MDKAAILNYPGSKRRLLDFILSNSKKYLSEDSVILDIFCGTGSVAEMFKNEGFTVCANDSENYSRNIAFSLLNGLNDDLDLDLDQINSHYEDNYLKLSKNFSEALKTEESLISSRKTEIEEFDLALPKIWKGEGVTLYGKNYEAETELRNASGNLPFCLFTTYYSGYYFGLKQSIQIDSIRYAIEQCNSNNEVLLTCLYYAMKEATFSKDGHMAQPLNHAKNLRRLFKCREKDIYEIFRKKLNDFKTEKKPCRQSRVFNLPFEELILDTNIMHGVDFIYADPPYTDMQYSRYFHLLNTVTAYDYPDLTRKNGKLTTGLYADNRFQSKISNKKSALPELSDLMHVAKRNGCVLAFSYAFPVDRENQPTDRYTMNIDDLIDKMRDIFPKVDIIKENFKHCNNRNSAAKKVYEYLIIGVPDGK